MAEAGDAAIAVATSDLMISGADVTSPQPTFVSMLISSSILSTPSINTSPFFPEPSTFHPPPNPEQANRNLAKNVVIYLTVSVVGVTALFILLKGYTIFKRTNRPLSHILPWPWRGPNPTSHSPPTQQEPRPPLPYALPLSSIQDPANVDSPDDDIRYPITAVSLHSLYASLYPDFLSHPYHYPRAHTTDQHRHRTRTRAINTDDQGRRMDSMWDPDQLGSNPFDYAENISKEVLPAYDRSGGPPNYADVEIEMDIVRRAMAEPDGSDEEEGRDRNGA